MNSIHHSPCRRYDDIGTIVPWAGLHLWNSRQNADFRWLTECNRCQDLKRIAYSCSLSIYGKRIIQRKIYYNDGPHWISRDFFFPLETDFWPTRGEEVAGRIQVIHTHIPPLASSKEISSFIEYGEHFEHTIINIQSLTVFKESCIDRRDRGKPTVMSNQFPLVVFESADRSKVGHDSRDEHGHTNAVHTSEDSAHDRLECGLECDDLAWIP